MYSFHLPSDPCYHKSWPLIPAPPATTPASTKHTYNKYTPSLLMQSPQLLPSPACPPAYQEKKNECSFVINNAFY